MVLAGKHTHKIKISKSYKKKKPTAIFEAIDEVGSAKGEISVVSPRRRSPEEAIDFREESASDPMVPRPGNGHQL